MTPFRYRDHVFEPSDSTVMVPIGRFGESRLVEKRVWDCHGPHGWIAGGEVQPVTRSDAKALLRYRISEGVTA